MSTLLLSILGLSIGAQQCLQWREIAPCTCRKDTSIIIVSCEKMTSYTEIVNTLKDKFSPSDRMELRIGHSILDDLPLRKFTELNTTIEKIQLQHDNLWNLSASSFDGLTRLNLLSLADNNIGIVPEHILAAVPNVRTLDLGRIGINQLYDYNFKSLPQLHNIILGGNSITQMESNSIPKNIKQLHLGRNKIKNLNKTLIHLTELEWIFINANELTSLQDELPITAPRLVMIHAAYNKIEKLPQHLKTYNNLKSLFIHNNMLTSLDGVLAKLHKLERAPFENNRINILTREDFLETGSLQCLCMGNNQVTSLNNSLHPLSGMGVLNMTSNLLTEFSFEEIKGLQKLRTVDLSRNKIVKLIGPTANVIEWETKIRELFLSNNHIEFLNGALSSLSTLVKLDLSYNKITQLSPDDLIGLDKLEVMDISHNRLTTLEETGKSVLPSLSELVASFNYLTLLDHDFDGLPVLCWADLSNNKIVALRKDLVSKTRCRRQDNIENLKIFLEDNPILCDAALPEIVSAMEINHTRIIGVSHCGPLNEQPTTSKPNGFYGYIPDDIYETTFDVNRTHLPNNNEYLLSTTNKSNEANNQPIKLIPITDLLLSPTIFENNNYKTNTQNQPVHSFNLSKINDGESENNNIEINPSSMNLLLNNKELPQKHIVHNNQAINSFEKHLIEEDKLNQTQSQTNNSANTISVAPNDQEDQLNTLRSQPENFQLQIEDLTTQKRVINDSKITDNRILNSQDNIETKEITNITEQTNSHSKLFETSKDTVDSKTI